MSAVLSARKDLTFKPNAERPCHLHVDTYSGRTINVYARIHRKVHGAFQCPSVARASAPIAECSVYHMPASVSASGCRYDEVWSLFVGTAVFAITKPEADRLIAEFGFKLEELRS